MNSTESFVCLGRFFFMESWSCNDTARRIQLVEVAAGDLKLIQRDKGFPKKQKNYLVKIHRFSVHPLLWGCQRPRRVRLLAVQLKGCLWSFGETMAEINSKKMTRRRLLLQWKWMHLLDEEWLLTNVCAFGLANGCRPKDWCRRWLCGSRNTGDLRGQYADGTVQSALVVEFI